MVWPFLGNILRSLSCGGVLRGWTDTNHACVRLLNVDGQSTKTGNTSARAQQAPLNSFKLPQITHTPLMCLTSFHPDPCLNSMGKLKYPYMDIQACFDMEFVRMLFIDLSLEGSLIDVFLGRNLQQTPYETTFKFTRSRFYYLDLHQIKHKEACCWHKLPSTKFCGNPISCFCVILLTNIETGVETWLSRRR